MLQAMNTGHDGSLSTGHANSSEDMLGRIETLVLMAKEIPLIAIRRQIASALDIMVHLGRGRDMVRRVLEVSEVLYKEGEISLNTLFSYKDNKLVRTENRMQNILKLQEYDLGELT